MTREAVMALVGMIASICNCSIILMTFPRRKSLRVTIAAITGFAAFFFIVLYLADAVAPDWGGLPSLAFLPMVIWLFAGYVSQRVFQFFLQFILVSFQMSFAEVLSGIFAGYGERVSFAVFLIAIGSMMTAYVFAGYRLRHLLFEQLYSYGSKKEWTLYAFGAFFSFSLITSIQIAPHSIWYILMLLFILWSFVVLCFAIINTREKARLKYEAEFARDVISSGSEHYQKMNELLDAIRVLRHDYKYHLDTIGELLNAGDKCEAEKYLADIKLDLAAREFPIFCSNPVLNALLISYSERCARLDIKLAVKISMPGTIPIPNYEMCIVLGNLLENAVCACERKDGNRKIDLVINTQGVHLAVMVKNTYEGEIIQGNDRLVSKKKDGGIGIRSVQAVAARYGGELMHEWDGSSFSAYVLLRL